jgi:hypothetical protein
MFYKNKKKIIAPSCVCGATGLFEVVVAVAVQNIFA